MGGLKEIFYPWTYRPSMIYLISLKNLEISVGLTKGPDLGLSVGGHIMVMGRMAEWPLRQMISSV